MTIIKINGSVVFQGDNEMAITGITPAVDFQSLHVKDGTTTIDFVTKAGSKASEFLFKQGIINVQNHAAKS